jgi:hypothetical protein
MLLHVLDATNRGTTSICIQSPDTDVVVLALWIYKGLCPSTSVSVGPGGKRRTIKLRPLHAALGVTVVSALPGFHAFSGCDQSGTFCGKSKISRWNALQKSGRRTEEAFETLGLAPTLQEDYVNAIQTYTCQL